MTTEELIEDDTNNNTSTDKLVLYDPIQAGLTDLEEKYQKGPASDLSIKENYEQCRLACSELRGIRVKTEKLRKELKADALEYGRKVDSIAKGIIDRILKIEEPYATAKKDHDTAVEVAKREAALAEERRVDGIAKRIATIGGLVAAHVSSSSAEIAALLPELHDDFTSAPEWAMEFADKAVEAITDTIAKLEELHAMKVQHEQAAIEKARAEKEAAEKAEAERIQREKELAAESERLAKEREEIEREHAAIQAEKDRLAAEQAERERIARAEQEEKDRIAREEQAEKDRLAEEERARLAAEIEALKKAQEQPAEQPETKQVPVAPTTTDTCPNENYKAAGRAIMAITGSKATAKSVLDSIINGEIPFIIYTGAAQ